MKFLCLFILCLLPHLGLAQVTEEETTEILHDDEEAVTEELTQAREKRQKSIQAIEKVSEKASALFDPNIELKKLGYDSFTPGSLFKTEVLDLMEKTLRQAKLNEASPDMIRKLLMDSFKGHPLEKHFNRSPRLQNFIIDLMRDEKALYSLIAIFKDKDRLKHYLYIWIGIMFASYFLKRLFISTYWQKSTQWIVGLLFSITVSLITLSSFCIVFKEEVRPVIALVKKNF